MNSPKLPDHRGSFTLRTRGVTRDTVRNEVEDNVALVERLHSGPPAGRGR